jgi:hypothetical protein
MNPSFYLWKIPKQSKHIPANFHRIYRMSTSSNYVLYALLRITQVTLPTATREDRTWDPILVEGTYTWSESREAFKQE